jgi:glycosyltransferase involved in cell wall biosynthesis
VRILFISAIDFPEPLDRGARYHIHYWLKALAVEHQIDFLLVESYSTRRSVTPRLSHANVIDLSESPRMDPLSRVLRVLRSTWFGLPTSALIAMPQAARNFVGQAVKDKRYDLAILWAGSASGYVDLLEGSVPTIISKLSVGAVDARDQRERKGMWHPWWALNEWVTRRFERRTCRAASAVCTVNEEDAAELTSRNGLTNIVRTIPIGVELSEFPARDADPNSKVVSFIGNLKWGANVDALRWLVQEIFPEVLTAHPDAELRIIGPGEEEVRKEFASDKVKFLGYVPSVRGAMADVAVGVVPVRSGTGMRLKLMELLSMGIPAVTTTLGAAGFQCTHGEQALIADDAGAFASAVNLLLSDAVLREKWSRNGPTVARQFSWDAIIERVQILANDTVGGEKQFAAPAARAAAANR